MTEYNPLNNEKVSEFLVKLGSLLNEYDVELCVEEESVGYSEWDSWLEVTDSYGNGVSLGKGVEGSDCTLNKVKDVLGCITR